MTRKANDANFSVEKYGIARDETLFEKDAQAPETQCYFEDKHPALMSAQRHSWACDNSVATM